MANNFRNTPATYPYQPVVPIQTSDPSWRGNNPTRPMNEPIVHFPYMVVKNVMFFVEKIMSHETELEQLEMGSRYVPAAGTTMLKFMEDAVLCHVEPVVEDAQKRVFRLYYMVPPKEQWRYNIQEMHKISDGYTLETTATDPEVPAKNYFYDQTTAVMNTPPKFKVFYEIARTWVEPVSEAYARQAIGTFDPSNQDVTPDFRDDHAWTGYDAQLVDERVEEFSEAYLQKLFRKVTRIYKTVPGPVVKELVPYNFWIKGDTVWQQGGPDTLLPEGDWKAQVGVKLSREVWAAPLWDTRLGGTEPHKARVPRMPRYDLPEQPYQEGWDKASYPTLQNYVLISMYQRYSNLTLTEDKTSVSGNCCNPDGRFTRCINTTITTESDIDWTANGDIPTFSDERIEELQQNCAEYRADASVVVREGHSVKETRVSCTSYDIPRDENGQAVLWESQYDSMTGKVFPVKRVLVENPSTDFTADGNFEQRTDANGNTYWVRTDDETGGYVLRQWVNPCYAVDSYMQYPGTGYYRRYTTVQHYSFPQICSLRLQTPDTPATGDYDLGYQIVRTRPDLSGKYSVKWFPWFRVTRDSYSGPCEATVEEWFFPNTTDQPPNWKTGVDVQYITDQWAFKNPLFELRIPSSIHPALVLQATNGTEGDAEWQLFNITYNIPATNYTTWLPVTTYQVQPSNGGFLYKKTTIQPPTI